jgi:WD40 repeat protein
LAAGDQYGAICFWDTADWREIRRLKAHTKGVRSLAFSPNGKFLASAGEDGLLSLRNADTGEEIRSLCKREPRRCSRLAFSPDSKMVAWSWGAEATIRLFEVSSGKEIRQFHVPLPGIATLAFSPDGKSMASASYSTIRLWDVQTAKEIISFLSPRSPISSLAFCANDTILAGVAWGSLIYCWDPVRGKELRRLKGHSKDPYFIAASPDSQTLLSADRDGFVRRWDPTKAKELQSFHLNEPVAPRAVSPDGKMLATQDFALQTGSVYNLLTGKELCRFGAAWNTIFLPDGKSLMLHDPDQGLIRWDIASGKIVARLPGDTRQNTCLAVSPDGQIFASGTANNRVHRWDLRSGEALSSLDGQQKSISCLAFSPDGRTLASGGKDGSIWLWEMLTGQKRLVLRGHKGPVLSLAFTRDGRRLASGSKDTTVLVWDLTAGLGAAHPKEFTAEQLDGFWRDLAGDDAAKAYSGMWSLASGSSIFD